VVVVEIKTEKVAKYSQFVILVCNVPSEAERLEEHKRITDGLTARWKEKHGDPNGERIHIIYLDARDNDPDLAKFDPLKNVDNESLIYIVGHCSPGSNYISSDPVYETGEIDPETKQPKKSKERFSYEEISLILLQNIKSEEVVFPYSKVISGKAHLDSLNQRLKICIPSCYSAVDSVDENGKVTSASFSEKLLKAITVDSVSSVIKCNLIGAKGFLVPAATESGVLNSIRLLLHTTLPTGWVDAPALGFHKRYWRVDKSGPFSTLVPEHKPDTEYKVMYFLSNSNTPSNPINISTLTVSETKKRLEAEVHTEKILSECEKISSDPLADEETKKRAEDIKAGILNGDPSVLAMNLTSDEKNKLTFT